MPRWVQKRFWGWGRVNFATSMAARPERISDLDRALLDARNETLIAFGAGRSYGDAALNSGGRSIITRRLDRFLEFDRGQALLVAEAGVTFHEVVETALSLGFMPSAVPGTGFATLGGGLACDVHGKNHHQVGSFGQHIEWFDLLMPNAERVRVDRVSHPRLFRATLGGMGLTGIVERLAIKLHPVPSNAVEVCKSRIPDLDRFLEKFEQEKDRSPYVVGWIDALASGKSLGRGILETASPAAQFINKRRTKSKRIPVDFPAFALNPLSVKAFNWLYNRHVAKAGWSGVLPYRDFLFPLDAVHEWNRIYGKRGFRQFQCVVPFATGRKALRQLLERIVKMKRGSFLAVLKSMGPTGLGALSFPMPGYTLALDFPNAPGITDFLKTLADIVCDHGGKIYLAKDSALTPAQFNQMYPAASEFQMLLNEIDPRQRLRSDMAARLGLKVS